MGIQTKSGFFALSLALSALALQSGCNDGSAIAAALAPSPQVQAMGDAQAAKLNLVNLGDELTDRNSNRVTISGTGANRIATVEYEFNSHNLLSLTLVKVVQISDGSAGCDAESDTFKLVSNGLAVSLAPTQSVRIEGGTSYALRVSRSPRCAMTSFTVDVVVAAGYDFPAPGRDLGGVRIARYCRINNPHYEVWFLAINAVTPYTNDESSGMLDFSGTTSDICGSPVTYRGGYQNGGIGRAVPAIDGYSDIAIRSGRYGGTSSFDLTFDRQTGFETGTLVCHTGGNIQSYSLSGCSDRIVNFDPFI